MAKEEELIESMGIFHAQFTSLGIETYPEGPKVFFLLSKSNAAYLYYLFRLSLLVALIVVVAS